MGFIKIIDKNAHSPSSPNFFSQFNDYSLPVPLKYRGDLEHQTFLEVYNNKGKPFKTYFYMTDEGMLWASMHLFLRKCLSRT